VAVGVQEVYDAVAQAYDRQFGDELAAKPLDRALLTGFVELVGRGRIADVGCGPGHVTRFLATQHPDVVGIDLSPDMIGIARERSPEMGFTVASMLALPASDGQWAGVVALYSVFRARPAVQAADSLGVRRTRGPQMRDTTVGEQDTLTAMSAGTRAASSPE